MWVAQSGGDFTTLSAALASITDNSASKPYLIRIAPGIHTETLPTLLKDYVDIEGSGQDTTTITCACGTNDVDAQLAVLAVVGAGQHIEVRNLAVANTGGGDLVLSRSPPSPSHRRCRSTMSPPPQPAASSTSACTTRTSSPTMSNVTVTATGGTNNYGVYNRVSSPTMSNVTVTATGGTNNIGVLKLCFVADDERRDSVRKRWQRTQTQASSTKEERRCSTLSPQPEPAEHKPAVSPTTWRRRRRWST